MMEHALPLWAGIGIMFGGSLLFGAWWAAIIWWALRERGRR